MPGEPPSGSKSTRIISKDSNFNQNKSLKDNKNWLCTCNGNYTSHAENSTDLSPKGYVIFTKKKFQVSQTWKMCLLKPIL